MNKAVSINNTFGLVVAIVFFIIVVLLVGCASKNLIVKADLKHVGNEVVGQEDEFLRWENNLLSVLYGEQINSPDDFVGLGIGRGKNIERATFDSKFMSRMNLGEFISCYIVVMEEYSSMYTNSNNNITEIDELKRLFFSGSAILIQKERYNIIDKFTVADTVFVATIVRKNRNEYYREKSTTLNESKAVEEILLKLKDFISAVDKEYLDAFDNIAKDVLKNKGY